MFDFSAPFFFIYLYQSGKIDNLEELIFCENFIAPTHYHLHPSAVILSIYDFLSKSIKSEPDADR